jgi:hypothetical protein
VWEYQLDPLRPAHSGERSPDCQTTRWWRSNFYDGSDSRTLGPMHIDLKGKAGVTKAVVITVH